MKDSIFVFSCITIESLENAGINVANEYHSEFSISPYYKSNKKKNKLNSLSKKKSINSNPSLNIYSSNNDCVGISDSASITLIERDLYYIEQVEFLELYTDPNTLIIDQDADSSFTVSFRASTGIPNVPVKFDNQSENIAPLSASEAYTNESGYAIVTAVINPDDVGNDFTVIAYVEDMLNPQSDVNLFE